MAQAKMKWVAFRTNTTVPAAVIGAKKDQKLQVGKPVELPAAYADHVVHDRFADFCDPDEAGPKKAAPKKAAPKKAGGSSAEEKAEAATRLKAAQARVDGLKANIEKLPGGAPVQAELAKELTEAEADLAALQSAS